MTIHKLEVKEGIKKVGYEMHEALDVFIGEWVEKGATLNEVAHSLRLYEQALIDEILYAED